MQSALDMFLRRFIIVGRLTVRWPDGRTQIYAGRPGPEAGVLLRDRLVRRLFRAASRRARNSHDTHMGKRHSRSGLSEVFAAITRDSFGASVVVG